MSDNLNIWNAVNKTDPAHTKAVTFGRKFTSIDAHWQIMRATEQFGPVGQGWGYFVQHSVERLTPEMILAVADVTVWWRDNDRRHEYGPVRGTCEMYGPKTDKGKPIPGIFITDEDAPKKAMTDALTKGLSHLGFSADVFLGLFDDNRYVQKIKREFEAGTAASTGSAGDGTQFRPERRGGSDWVEEARRDGTLDETRQKGTLPAAHRQATPVNTTAAAGNAVKRIEWVRKSVAFLKDSSTDAQIAREWWTENKARVDVIETALPTEYERLLDAYNEALERKVDA